MLHRNRQIRHKTRFNSGLNKGRSPLTHLAYGLTWLGGLGLLGSGLSPSVSLAQTPEAAMANPESATQMPAVPAVPLEPAAAAPTTEPVMPWVPPVPAAPENFPAEFAAPESSTAPIPNPTIAPSDGPSAVILNERSTGCRAVVADGEVASACTGTIAELGGGRSPASLPKLSAVSVAAMAFPSGNSLSSGSGFGTTPSVKDYYRRTLRPPGQLGNGNIRLVFPLAIPAAISSVFGWRLHPISGDTRFHTGTDLAAPMGTPVLAAYAGQVAMADFLGGYGLTVVLGHNQGTQQTLYAHLSEIFVQPGELVKQGEVIGRVGSTGNSTGAHLHFEFRQWTPEGWVALDAGSQLEYALAQLVRSLDFAQAPTTAGKSSVGAAGVILAEPAKVGEL
jgi:murein DD-endopeptidase MepM/ murein hydrolase activator NlpD